MANPIPVAYPADHNTLAAPQPLKILYLNTAGILGGAELCLLDGLASLRGARPDWRPQVVLGDDGPLGEAVAALGVPCEVVPLPERMARLGDAGLRDGRGARLRLASRAPAAAATTAAYLARLRRVVRLAGPDLVQTNGMKAHVLGVWATPRTVPVIWHLHDYVGPRMIMSRLWRLTSRRGVSAVAVSRSVAADAAGALGPSVPVLTIHNAVDLSRFAPGPGDGAMLDSAAGLPPAPLGTLRVGLVATFATWKGHDVFLEAAARIAADRPCRFYIVGGPLYRSAGSQRTIEELTARARGLGLRDRVGFAGHQADPAAAIRALDVVVHASTRPEPFGRVIVEAMACGRPTIAVLDGGAAELFDDGRSALGVPPGDPAALASVIDRLLIDPELRQRLAEAGRAAALAQFDRGRLMERWLPVYEQSDHFLAN
jgi:glycosyltransferase involved in cell wall biosynthesis